MKMAKFILSMCSVLFVIAFIYGNVGYFTHTYSISYSGFAVDSQGIIYIGVDNGKICKYDDGELIDTIPAYTSRGYNFTITENDTVFVHCGDRAYFTDLEGNILEKFEEDIPYFSEFRKNKRVFVSGDGTKYEQRFNFGRTKIIKHQDGNKIVVFEMPLKNYFFKMVIIIGWYLFFVLTLVIIIKTYKEKETQ